RRVNWLRGKFTSWTVPRSVRIAAGAGRSGGESAGADGGPGARSGRATRGTINPRTAFAPLPESAGGILERARPVETRRLRLAADGHLRGFRSPRFFPWHKERATAMPASPEGPLRFSSSRRHIFRCNGLRTCGQAIAVPTMREATALFLARERRPARRG